jgi:hypothetical protein
MRAAEGIPAALFGVRSCTLFPELGSERCFDLVLVEEFTTS